MYTDLIAELLNQSDKQRYAAIAQHEKLGHSKASELLSHLEALIPNTPPGGSFLVNMAPETPRHRPSHNLGAFFRPLLLSPAQNCHSSLPPHGMSPITSEETCNNNPVPEGGILPPGCNRGTLVRHHLHQPYPFLSISNPGTAL